MEKKEEKPSDKFITFVKEKYNQRDHNTIYLFENMIDPMYQGVLNGLIDECFASQQKPEIEYKDIQEAWEKFTPKGQVLKEDFCAIMELKTRIQPSDLQKEVERLKEVAKDFKEYIDAVIKENGLTHHTDRMRAKINEALNK